VAQELDSNADGVLDADRLGGVTFSTSGQVSGAKTLVVEKNDNYTFALGDDGKTFKMTVTGKTFTVPARATVAFATGTFFNVDASLYETTVAVTSDTLISDGSKTKVKVGTVGTILLSGATTVTLTGNLV